MATSNPDPSTEKVAAPSSDFGQTVSLPSEAAPAAAAVEDAATSSANAASASQEQGSAEPPKATTGPPPTTVEHDPAPIQPPIQPVRFHEREFKNNTLNRPLFIFDIDI